MRTCCKTSCKARVKATTKRVTRTRPRSPQPVTTRRDEQRQGETEEQTKVGVFSIISTETEIHGHEVMLIMKHVNLTVQGSREVPRQGRSEQGQDRRSTTAVPYEATSQRKAAASPEASKNRCSCLAGATQMVWPSGGNNYREHQFNKSCYRK